MKIIIIIWGVVCFGSGGWALTDTNYTKRDKDRKQKDQNTT